MGVRILNVRIRLLQFRLAKLHDGSQSQLVPRLRQFQRQVGLLFQLLGNRQSLVRILAVQPAIPHIARDVIL